MEPTQPPPVGHTRSIDQAITYLEKVTEDRYLEGGANTELSTIILARMDKHVRTIKNIVVFWFVMFCIAVATGAFKFK